MTDATATTIETRKRMYDAAVIAGDYQASWKNYMAEQNKSVSYCCQRTS